MKVLQKGGGPKLWSTKRTCSGNGNFSKGCGAKLLVDEEDLFITASSALGDEETSITFECPLCRVLTDLPPEVCPAIVERNLPRHSQWLKRQKKKKK